MAGISDHAVTPLGRALTDGQRAALAAYVVRLAAATAQMNLSAVRDPAGIERRHIGESLALVRVLEERGLLPADVEVVDVGSGGGLPGIPLAIVRPDVDVTLLEATNKKARFLQETVAALALARVAVLMARSEEAGRGAAHREHYDLAIARAVASLDVLAELALPLVRIGGWVAAVKGSRVQKEAAAGAAAIGRCGGRLDAIVPLPADADGPLSVALIAKVAATPAELPRRPGMPAKRPLR